MGFYQASEAPDKLQHHHNLNYLIQLLLVGEVSLLLKKVLAVNKYSFQSVLMLDAYLHFVKKKNKRKYFDSNINEKPDKVFANKIL